MPLGEKRKVLDSEEIWEEYEGCRGGTLSASHTLSLTSRSRRELQAVSEGGKELARWIAEEEEDEIEDGGKAWKEGGLKGENKEAVHHIARAFRRQRGKVI